jgi:hypothetical protein
MFGGGENMAAPPDHGKSVENHNDFCGKSE